MFHPITCHHLTDHFIGRLILIYRWILVQSGAVHSFRQNDDLADRQIPDLLFHRLVGNQKNFNLIVPGEIHQNLRTCERLDLKGNILLLHQIFHKVVSVFNFCVTNRKYVLFLCTNQ